MLYRRICHLFFLFKLTVSLLISKKILSLTLFKIITGSRSSTLLRVFLMGRSGCPTKKKNERWGSLPVSQKVWSFPFCWKSPPAKNWDHLSPDHRYIGKKVLIAFRQILSKILPEACIFSNIIMTYLKKLVGTNFSPNIHGKPWRWTIIPPNSQNVPIYPTKKITLMKFTSSAIKSVIPSHEIVIFI